MSLFFDTNLIIFDLDNTLVFPETCVSINETVEFVRQIAKVRQCVILTNSKSATKRGRDIQKLFNCEIFLSDNQKPFSSLFRELKDRYSINSGRTVIVGDRIFSDILFGNLNGLKTILVEPMTKEESFAEASKRTLENLSVQILRFFLKNR